MRWVRIDRRCHVPLILKRMADNYLSLGQDLSWVRFLLRFYRGLLVPTEVEVWNKADDLPNLQIAFVRAVMQWHLFQSRGAPLALQRDSGVVNVYSSIGLPCQIKKTKIV